MADNELDELRSKRMAELQQQQSGMGGAGGGANSAQQQEEMKRQQNEMINNILTQVLTQEARARRNNYFTRNAVFSLNSSLILSCC